MSPSPLMSSYELARRSMASSLDGITDGEGLLTPARGVNSVNWVAGHILLYRDRLHALLDLEPAWPQRLGPSEGYRRGATGRLDESAPSLDVLRRELDQSQALVLRRLADLQPDRFLAAATPTRTVEEQLALFGNHDWYHIGQLALLRRLLGKPPALG